MSKVCKKCGYNLDLESRFCPKCGYRVNLEDNDWDINKNKKFEINFSKRKIVILCIILILVLCLGILIFSLMSDGKAKDNNYRNAEVHKEIDEIISDDLIIDKKIDDTNTFGNANEIDDEKDNSLSNVDIIAKIQVASKFSNDLFWDSSRDYVDETDSYVEYDESGNSWEYKRVDYEGIHCLNDIRDLAKHYFTDAVCDELISLKNWYEQNDKIYVSEPDGIGGVQADRYDIRVKKESDIRYTITIYEYLNNELWEEPYDVHLTYIDGYWVFDTILTHEGDPVQVNWIDDTEICEENKEGNLNNFTEITLLGEWYSENYNVEYGWVSSYETIFYNDGTIVSLGWRNEDHGTYEIKDDGETIVAYFSENYLESPIDGKTLLENFEYSVKYTFNIDEQALYASYSKDFYEVGYSNAYDGKLIRDP